MCGILGQIGLEKTVIRDKNKLEKALDLLTHRGPDDKGVVLDDRFIFGHRRLSIIDLSHSSSQPMITNDNQVIIVLNGEIYNYKELKEELQGAGYVFKTLSDTEVLLNGYHCFGISFVEKCIGMFAFAVYDKRYNKAYIVRDRLGIKPLYYTRINGRITFSSEIKSILALEDVNKRLNKDAVVSYLSYRYPILDDTFFENIYSLPPGHFMEIQKGAIKTVKYWDPVDKYMEEEKDKGEQFYIDRLQDILVSSTRYRLISDVPLGVLLSGGVDSSIIAAITSEETQQPLNTFTIGYDEDGYNEFNYARLAAQKYKTNHHEILTDDDAYFEHLDKLIWFKDAPLTIPNEVTQYEMSMKLKKDVTVILAGTGADELFYGYGRIFRSTYDYERLIEFGTNKHGKDIFLNNFQEKYGRKHFKDEIEHFSNVYNYSSLENKRLIFNENFVNLDQVEEKFICKFRNYFNEVPTGRYIDKMGYTFLKVHLPGILHHNDISSMAASVELRVPYLDHRLVEFAMTIPVDYKLKWNSEKAIKQSRYLMSDKISEVFDTPKYIIKKAFESKIPIETLKRKKLGFPVPLHFWMGGEAQKFIRNLLLGKKSVGRGMYKIETLRQWFDKKDIDKHYGDSATYQFSIAGKIWMLANLEMFLRKHFD